MDDFKRIQNKRVGIGGVRCPCCNDYYGKRKAGLNRYARRVLKQRLSAGHRLNRVNDR